MPPVVRVLSAAGWARVIAPALLILAVVVTWLDLRRAPRVSPRPIPVMKPVDPLQAELLRCQVLGQAGAGDPGCLAVWAESRRRFLEGPRS